MIPWTLIAVLIGQTVSFKSQIHSVITTAFFFHVKEYWKKRKEKIIHAQITEPNTLTL